MPKLAAAGYRCLAPDLPSLGDAAPPEDGRYDTDSVARTLHARLRPLTQARRYHLVTHDIGTWVGYPYAAQFSDEVLSLVLSDAALPGLPSSQTGFPLTRAVASWHFFFHALPELPATLIEGRETAYLDWFFRNKSARSDVIAPEVLAHYAAKYSGPGRIYETLAYYRSIFDSMEQNRTRARNSKLAIPILCIGAEMGVGDRLGLAMAEAAQNARSVVFKGAGHYLPEETPEAFAAAVLPFMAEHADGPAVSRGKS
jgi:microsomal epoxide hydrolase